MSKLRIGYNGMLQLSGKFLTDSELLTLQSKVLEGDHAAREEFIYQMIPGANKIAMRLAIQSEKDIGDETACFAYLSVVRAVSRYKPNSVPMKQFVFLCVKRELHNRLRQLLFASTGDGIASVPDPGPTPAEIIEQSIDSEIAMAVASRKMQSPKRRWSQFGRYFGLSVAEPEAITKIARDDGVTKQAVSANVIRAVDSIRKEMKIA